MLIQVPECRDPSLEDWIQLAGLNIMSESWTMCWPSLRYTFSIYNSGGVYVLVV
jgi:hypothetical protein